MFVAGRFRAPINSNRTGNGVVVFLGEPSSSCADASGTKRGLNSDTTGILLLHTTGCFGWGFGALEFLALVVLNVPVHNKHCLFYAIDSSRIKIAWDFLENEIANREDPGRLIRPFALPFYLVLFLRRQNAVIFF